MKSVNSLLLCLVYAIFLMLGGVMFRYLEYEEVTVVEVEEPPEWEKLKGKKECM